MEKNLGGKYFIELFRVGGYEKREKECTQGLEENYELGCRMKMIGKV